MSIRVVVSILVQADKGHLQESAFTALAPRVRVEPGCLRYDLHRVKDSPDQYVLLDEWGSEAALAAHNASPHMVEAGKTNQTFRAGPADVTKLDGHSIA